VSREQPVPRLVAFLTALTWGALAAVALYATLRFVQVATTHETPPADVLVAGPVGYFWRGATALFGGVLTAFAAYVMALRDARAATRALPAATLAVTAVLIAQAAFAP
jgi:hypothetical protein